MISEGLIDAVKRVRVEEAQTDVVGLYAIAYDFVQADDNATDDDVMSATIEVVRRVLIESNLVVGQFVVRDADTWLFVPWKLPVDAVVTRILNEWSAIRRMPNPGEIAWFVARDLLPVILMRVA